MAAAWDRMATIRRIARHGESYARIDARGSCRSWQVVAGTLAMAGRIAVSVDGALRDGRASRSVIPVDRRARRNGMSVAAGDAVSRTSYGICPLGQLKEEDREVVPYMLETETVTPTRLPVVHRPLYVLPLEPFGQRITAGVPEVYATRHQ